MNDRRDGIRFGAEQQPGRCKHCGRIPAASIPIGTGADGRREIACIPVCPPADNDQDLESAR